VFEPIRVLDDNEAEAVLELRKSAVVTSILAEDIGEVQETHAQIGAIGATVTPQVTPPTRPTPVPAAPVPAASDGFGGVAPKPPVAAPQPKPTKKAQPAAVAPPPVAPVTHTPEAEDSAAGGSFEESLDAQLDNLLPGVA
jgi:hypothetical protein